MKLWKLALSSTNLDRAVSDGVMHDWRPMTGAVVVAADEQDARRVCAEVVSPKREDDDWDYASFWLDPDGSTCTEIGTTNGGTEMRGLVLGS